MMNYIEQIKGFWRLHEEHSFSTTEIALYFQLLEVCNICRWKNPFRRNNAKIIADLSISFNTLKNARNKLQQLGLISFRTKNGSPNVEYTLSEFDKLGDKVKLEVASELADEQAAEVLPTKVKLNQAKPKKYANHCDEDVSKFEKFTEWITENAPNVARMREPFTIDEYVRLRDEFDYDMILDVLLAMHNWADLLKKRVNANLTFRNFAKKQKP